MLGQFLQHPGGAPRVVAFDPATLGVGSGIGDADQLQRAAVDPHAVVVAVDQGSRAIGHQFVQLLAGGEAAGEIAHRPAAAENPFLIGMTAGVGGDRQAGLLASLDLLQRALRHAVPGLGRVGVGVLKTGQEHPALHVDHAGAGAAVLGQLLRVADGEDAAVGDGDARGHSAGRVDGVDDAVLEDQVSGHGRYRNHMFSPERIEQRLVSLRTELLAGGLDGAVIVQNTDLAYFTGTNQQAHLIVPATGEPRLLVRRTLERARAESPLARIDSLRSLSGLAPALADAGLEPGSLIGFELDVLRAATYLGYVRRLDGYRIGDASAAIAAVRSRKSSQDIADMRVAAAQVDQATRAVPALLRVGLTESQVQVEVEGILRRGGPPRA